MIRSVHEYFAQYYISSHLVPFSIVPIVQSPGVGVFAEEAGRAWKSVGLLLILLIIPLLVVVVVASLLGSVVTPTLPHMASFLGLICSSTVMGWLMYVLKVRRAECICDTRHGRIVVRSLHKQRVIQEHAVAVEAARLMICPVVVFPGRWRGSAAFIDLGGRRFAIMTDRERTKVVQYCQPLSLMLGIGLVEANEELVLGGQSRLCG